MLKPVPAKAKILTPSVGSRSTRCSELFDVMPNIVVTDALERTSAQLELEIYFAGLNAAQGGAPTPARLRRFKPSLVQTLPLSGTQYAAYQVTGELLADMLVTEPGISQFYSLGMKAAV